MIKLFLLLFLSISVWANIGNIMAMKGEASVKRVSERVNANVGMELLKDDEILTQARSRVQVMLNDETVVTIGPNSSFGFEEFSFDGTSESKVSMKANRGFFRSVTGKIGKLAPERFKVKTSSATIGIRGTDFSGLITEVKQIIKCYRGSISVDFEGTSRDIHAGMMIELTADKVEIKKITSVQEEEESVKEEASKDKKEETKKSILFEDILDGEMDQKEIATEDIADVTPLVDEPPVIEPFELIPASEDREILY